MIPTSVILENSINVMYVKSNAQMDIVYNNSSFDDYASHINPNKVSDFIKEDSDVKSMERAIAKAKKQSPFPVGFQCQLKQKNGAMRWSVWEVVCNESEYHFIGIQLFDVVSITAHEYDKQRRQLEKIAWIQSHKIRRPLANILALAEFISKDESRERREEANLLKKSAEELDMVIREIVEISSEGNHIID